MTLDLDLLPPPDVIESLDYEAILAARRADFLARYADPDARAEMAERLEIEGEPVNIVLEALAYAELLIRNRINAAARSNLLAFATGGDLDQLAAFYGVARLPSETDARFRRRVQLQIAALAGNGTRERYQALALAAHADVIDAAVLSPSPGAVAVALWIRDLPPDAPLPPNTGYSEANAAHHAAVTAAVQAVFDADDQRMLGVPTTVYEAAPFPVAIVATIYREPQAPADLVDQIRIRMPDLLWSHAELGRDLARSRILAWLHQDGVSAVELATPEANVTIPPDGYAVAGGVTLTDGGVNW